MRACACAHVYLNWIWVIN